MSHQTVVVIIPFLSPPSNPTLGLHRAGLRSLVTSLVDSGINAWLKENVVLLLLLLINTPSVSNYKSFQESLRVKVFQV